MGLRCLLGHDFDEPEIEREREEDGNEVVTTVREVKTCSRCGETQIVSENTEVTTVQQLADQAAAVDDDGTDDPSAAHPGPKPETPAADSPAPTTDPATEGAVDGTEVETDASYDPADGESDAVERDPTIDDDPTSSEGPTVDDGAEIIDADAGIDDAPDDAGTGSMEGAGSTEGAGTGGRADAEGDGVASEGEADAETPGADRHGRAGKDVDTETGPAETPGDAETADAETADADDGVILDDEPEVDPDRDRGAWPDVEESQTPSEDPTPWPEQEAEDEGFDAEVGGAGDSGVEFGGGLTPTAGEEPSEYDDETEYVEPSDADAGTRTLDTSAREGETGAEPADVDTGFTHGDSPELRTSTAEAETEYYCPACGMTRGAEGSSMRAGDICPECKRGYVDERPADRPDR